MSRYAVVSAIFLSFLISACAPVGNLNAPGAGAPAASADQMQKGDETPAAAQAQDETYAEETSQQDGVPEDQVMDEGAGRNTAADPEEYSSDGEGKNGGLTFTTIDDAKKEEKEPEKKEEIADDHEDGELTSRELDIIRRDFNGHEYYGFLLSDYEDPKFIDWDQVLYTGGGIKQDSPSKDIVNEYLKRIGEDELMTDLIAISGDDLDEFVKMTTGLSYSKMRIPLDWVYLKDHDMYLSETGDTNYVKSRTISGYVEDGIFHVRYVHEGWWGDNADSEYTVSFRKNSDGYCFISNVPEKTAGKNDEYIIPDSDSRYITEDDIKGMDNETLRLARNEIFARHGRKFTDKALQEYFNGKSWYKGILEPEEVTEGSLNKYESYNVKFIKKYEK